MHLPQAWGGCHCMRKCCAAVCRETTICHPHAKPQTCLDRKARAVNSLHVQLYTASGIRRLQNHLATSCCRSKTMCRNGVDKQ